MFKEKNGGKNARNIPNLKAQPYLVTPNSSAQTTG
jgi:hypothetical protein